ncbi:MAG: ribonuclease HII [Firmicutes bacterium]|nr:ribonuclease HII [Bacillota bacterium]
MIEHPLEWDYEQLLVGLDEAGRGPICGPVVVAGVVFPKDYKNDLLDDSKKLSEKKRELLFHQVMRDALWYQILVVNEETIDRLNIYRACQEAMNTIAKNAPVQLALTDAMPLPNLGKEAYAIIKGDQKSLSIAGASILAKVTRDHYMYKLDELYPQYNLKKHKGYPTKAHLAAIEEYGVQDFYRKSYGPVQKQLEIKLF